MSRTLFHPLPSPQPGLVGTGEQWDVHHQIWELSHSPPAPPFPSKGWAAILPPGHSGFLLRRELSQQTNSPSSVFELRKGVWKTGISPFLSSVSFIKAGIGSKISLRELKFFGEVLLKEGWNRREENPRTFSSEEGNEKEVQ